MEFDNKPVYNIFFFLKTKIKSHGDKVTDFYDKIIPNYICVAVISIDSALKTDGNHYQQVFLKEFKYTKKKVIRHINYNLNDFSSSD